MKYYVDQNTVIYTGEHYVSLQEIMDYYDLPLDALLKIQVSRVIELANTLKAEAA